MTILNALGLVLTNIDNAPISLNGLRFDEYLDTQDAFFSRLSNYYKDAVLTQLFKVIGSIEILGNPV